MSQADPSPREVISEAARLEEQDGRFLVALTEGEYGRNVRVVREVLELLLKALRIASPTVTATDDAETVTEAIRQGSTALGS